MINGYELQQARGRVGWTQQELADRLGVVVRTVRGWESKGVPNREEGRVQDLLGDHLGDESRPLREASNMALLTEVGRRLDEADELMRRFSEGRGKGGQDARTAEAQKKTGKVGRGSTNPR